jgi:membrane protease YdiL (CAAX protease family)
MEGTPPVNRHVFAVILAVSILYLLYALILNFLIWLHASSTFPPANVIGGDYLLFTVGVQVALLAVLIYAGLYLGGSIGLGAPLLGSWAAGEPVRERAISALKLALALGLGVAAAKYLLDLLVFSPFVPATLSQLREAPALLRLAIPFQQGIGDEIIYRLFLMTVIVWILWKIRGSEEKPPGDPVYWAGILLAGLLAVAVPLLQGLTGPAMVQYAAIILAGAIPFGWLYWKRGIESALVAHFVSSVALVLLSLG